MPTEEELMAYCRVDADNAEAIELLNTLADNAQAYLTAAGITYNAATKGRYALAVKALVLHWFDNPDGGELSAGLLNLITQLKLTPAPGA